MIGIRVVLVVRLLPFLILEVIMDQDERDFILSMYDDIEIIEKLEFEEELSLLEKFVNGKA